MHVLHHAHCTYFASLCGAPNTGSSDPSLPTAMHVQVDLPVTLPTNKYSALGYPPAQLAAMEEQRLRSMWDTKVWKQVKDMNDQMAEIEKMTGMKTKQRSQQGFVLHNMHARGPYLHHLHTRTHTHTHTHTHTRARAHTQAHTRIHTHTQHTTHTHTHTHTHTRTHMHMYTIVTQSMAHLARCCCAVLCYVVDYRGMFVDGSPYDHLDTGPMKCKNVTLYPGDRVYMPFGADTL